MTKTPIRQAIERVENRINNTDPQTKKRAYLIAVLHDLQSLLPVEREAIEVAYLTGILGDAKSPWLKDDDRKAAQDYFTSTYNNPQGGGGK